MLKESVNLSTKITAAYIAAGSLWIVATDLIADDLSGSDACALALKLQTIKGLFFVFASGTLLFFLTQHLVSRMLKKDHQYKLMFRNNPTPMWVYETDTLRFLAVNDAAVRKYGYSEQEFLKMTLKDIRPPEENIALIKLIESIRGKAGFNHTTGWKHRTKKGEIIEVEILSHDIDFKGKTCRLVMSIDITEKIQHIRQIRKLNKNLVNEQQKIRQYSFANSHKIRRPLSNIRSITDIMRSRKETDPVLLEMLEASVMELDMEVNEINQILSEKGNDEE